MTPTPMTTTTPNSTRNSNNPPHPLHNLRLPTISSKQNIQRPLQRAFFFCSTLIPIPFDSVDQLGQFHQFQTIVF
jgi:hypothetical protein